MASSACSRLHGRPRAICEREKDPSWQTSGVWGVHSKTFASGACRFIRRGEATEWYWYQCVHSESLAALDAVLLAVSYHLYFRALDEPIAQSSWTMAARCPPLES